MVILELIHAQKLRPYISFGEFGRHNTVGINVHKTDM